MFWSLSIIFRGLFFSIHQHNWTCFLMTISVMDQNERNWHILFWHCLHL
jgi:hypothetical protein